MDPYQATSYNLDEVDTGCLLQPMGSATQCVSITKCSGHAMIISSIVGDNVPLYQINEVQILRNLKMTVCAV